MDKAVAVVQAVINSRMNELTCLKNLFENKSGFEDFFSHSKP